MYLMPNENSKLENKNLESLKCNILDATEEILLDNSHPDSNHFNTAIKNFDTPYVIPKEFRLSEGLLFLHINIRSIIRTLKISNYSILPWVNCNMFFWLRHDWMKQQTLIKHCMNYQSIHEVRKQKKW